MRVNDYAWKIESLVLSGIGIEGIAVVTTIDRNGNIETIEYGGLHARLLCAVSVCPFCKSTSLYNKDCGDGTFYYRCNICGEDWWEDV